MKTTSKRVRSSSKLQRKGSAIGRSFKFPRKVKPITEPKKIVFYGESLGIGSELAASLITEASKKVNIGHRGTVKSFRFLPSTRVDVPGGYQVLANTTVSTGRRLRSLNTTVTIDSSSEVKKIKDIEIKM